ncbi:MAG: glycosyltransferase family 4 protein [Acidimicrobiia bacterium]|nr:glycosyltransferase family 4 protein [Acidimicrobiia bacterium]
MKIALVSPYDFPYPGGVTEHVRNLARCLSDVGHHVRIIAPSSRDDVEVVHPEVYRVGSHITSVPANQSVARLTLSLTLRGRITQILDHERFDVVHLHEPLVPVLAPLVLRESRAANVGTFHCARDRYVGYALGRQVFRALLSRLDARITVSAEAHRFINSYFPHQYSPIPNGVETDHDPISDVCPEVMQDGTPTVLFLGRLERRKGLAVLIEAMNLVAARVSPIRLVVAGPFSEFAAGPFRELSHRLGLKDVVFVGQVSDTLRKQLYRHATVFCAPSTGRESQGIVLLEAMAAGTPVVASDIPGYRTALVHGESGLLAVAQDAASLAHCLVQAIGDERVRRTVIAGGLIAANRFSWKVIAPKILTIYETAIQSRTSTRFFSMPGMLPETGTFNSRFAGPAAS